MSIKKIIAHRGNLRGPDRANENTPDALSHAMKLGFDVECDVWVIDKKIYLGHDLPEYPIDITFLLDNVEKLWIHVKNVEGIEYFHNKNSFNWFWHEEDKITLTSKGFIWAYPGQQPIAGSVAVMPELNNEGLGDNIAICTDYSLKYGNENR